MVLENQLAQKGIKRVKHLKSEVLNKLSVLVTSAFGLVAALAWNEAIQRWFESKDLLRTGGPWLYAILVTVIAVLVTVWMGYIIEKRE